MYGAAPAENGDWLKVRGPIFWAYARMLPRLEAERQLATVNSTAAAFGSMAERDQKRYMHELERAATGRSRQVVKANKAMLAQMGIAVEQRA